MRRRGIGDASGGTVRLRDDSTRYIGRGCGRGVAGDATGRLGLLDVLYDFIAELVECVR